MAVPALVGEADRSHEVCALERAALDQQGQVVEVLGAPGSEPALLEAMQLPASEGLGSTRRVKA